MPKQTDAAQQSYIGIVHNSFMKSLATLFWIVAVLLSDMMCAVVAYNYCDLLWGAKYAGYSAPACTAFIYAVPFGIGIIISIMLAIIFSKKTILRKTP